MAEETPEQKAASDAAAATAAANVAAGKNPDGTEKTPAPKEPTAAEKAATEAANVAAGKNPDGTPKTDGKPAGELPKVPEKYSLKLPEQSPFTDADLTAFGASAKALGLTQDQAQKMVDLRVTEAQQAVTQAAERYLDALKADKDLGGANLERMTGLAIKGRDAFLDGLPKDEAEEIKGVLDMTGFGNHKGLIRAFARLGKLIAEDKPLRASGGEKAPKAGSTAEITGKLYKGTPGAGE